MRINDLVKFKASATGDVFVVEEIPFDENRVAVRKVDDPKQQKVWVNARYLELVKPEQLELPFPDSPDSPDFTENPSGALKELTSKSRVDLIPASILLELGDLYAYGVQKYAARNWEKGLTFSQPYGAALRHLFKFWSGEDVDPETGAKHVVAAAWNCIALAHHLNEGCGQDDRSKSEAAPEKAEEFHEW